VGLKKTGARQRQEAGSYLRRITGSTGNDFGVVLHHIQSLQSIEVIAEPPALDFEKGDNEGRFEIIVRKGYRRGLVRHRLAESTA